MLYQDGFKTHKSNSNEGNLKVLKNLFYVERLTNYS